MTLFRDCIWNNSYVKEKDFSEVFPCVFTVLGAKASHLSCQRATKVVANGFRMKFQASARFLGNCVMCDIVLCQ